MPLALMEPTGRCATNQVAERGALVTLEGLRADPHKGMHTRGG